MRRKEQEITERAEIEAILSRATVCHLAFLDGKRPYVVPVCYAYGDNTLYIHSAPEGHKMDLLRLNPQVCFEVEADVALLPANSACGWGIRYASVIGWGHAASVDDPLEKRAALDAIMAHYGEENSPPYGEGILSRTAIIKVVIESMTGKRSSK